MKFIHIAERIFNRPLMISEPKLNVILHVFGQKSGLDFVGLPSTEMIEVSDRERRNAGYTAKNGVGVIGVYGPLMHRVMAMDFPSGGPMTYADVRRAFDMALADDAVQGIVMDFGTPGGEVSGAFDLADHIYQSRGIKPITAVVNEEAFSAGYLLASAAEKIIIPRTGGVGSIGVIATHADLSRAEDMAGITVTHIYAGNRKADFSPHRPLSDDAQGVLQGMVNDTYKMFVDTVARNRGMKVADVRATEAGIFEGQKAIDMKLADEVSAADKAIANAKRGRGTRLIAASAPAAATKKENKAMTIEELREQHPDLFAQVENDARLGMISQADADSAQTQAVSGEQTRIMGLVSATLGEEVGGKLSAVVSAGLTVEQVSSLGISVVPQSAGNETEEKMLSAITAAASKGVSAAAVKTEGEETERKTASSRMAKAGSVN